MTGQPFDPSRARGGAGRSESAVPNRLTVSQLTALIKQAIGLHLPATVHVIGQISNFKRHGSGHLYWTLKDDQSELSCVMWRSDAARMKFKPADGLEVVATGAVDVFDRAGRYQLYARKLEPRGVGALELAFRQLCDKLRAQGMFDPRHKRLLPRFPRRIAVVTSPTGAAIRDIIQTLHRRYPAAAVCIYPVRVQGESAAGEIAGAIRAINIRRADWGGVDVMIVGRGGGSLEDLWAFNEEDVARAIYVSDVPIISAVGHESDTTIADLVADVRAATPTAAAELAVPVMADVLDEIAVHASSLRRVLVHRVEIGRNMLRAVERQGWLRDPAEQVRRRAQVVDDLADRMREPLAERVHRGHRRLAGARDWVQRLHPRTVLAESLARLLRSAHRLRWSGSGLAVSSGRRLERSTRKLLAASPIRRVDRERDRLEATVRRRHDGLVRRLEAG